MKEEHLEIFRKVRFISMWFALGVIAFAGLYFLTFADVKLGTESKWLFFAALTALGSAACVVVSELVKDNKILCASLKGASVLLAIGFIVVLAYFEPAYIKSIVDKRLVNTSTLSPEALAERKANALAAAHKNLDWLLISSYIIASVAVLSQVTHFVASMFTIKDDK